MWKVPAQFDSHKTSACLIVIVWMYDMVIHQGALQTAYKHLQRVGRCCPSERPGQDKANQSVRNSEFDPFPRKIQRIHPSLRDH